MTKGKASQIIDDLKDGKIENNKVAQNDTPTPVRHRRSLVNDGQSDRPKKPILLLVFIHDDLNDYDKGKLYDNYFSWLETELEEISGRAVTVIFNSQSTTPKMTNYNYKNENAAEALRGWENKVKELTSKAENTFPFNPNLDKFLLLTRSKINSSVAGIASNRGQSAMATIDSYLTPAHEIGHMFGATHEDSDIVYDGWWHDTIMKYDANSPVRGNYYHFSEKNRGNISNYLSQFD
ncbi:reprolysin-like metallopeptidase [Pseudomonas arsenicoxydans]|uniref:Metallo-peptidase family M12B Reprolysin-like n=1 Tax=Pseudomonas arsenicoxydans TaxID=702115 RepID=A0A4P6G0G5_9PSED|nr:hypothetical protein [Pseudomonas arsenicoxydans]QAY83446.1 hypothetical protein CUN61_05425 [Pseudomonas arsenicoxydans]